MAHNPHAHLQKEIDSLRKQLIQERDQRQYGDALRMAALTVQTEERTLERCIVECMEEANAPIYTEEERIAILTATERLKEMRAEAVKRREEQEHLQRKQKHEAERQFMLEQMMQDKNLVYRTAMDQAVLQGASITRMVMDEAAQVRWSNISNPKEWMK